MSYQIIDDRCPYICTDELTMQMEGRRTRDDGWRCGETEGHRNGHVLYTSDGEGTIYQGVGWELPIEDASGHSHGGSDSERQVKGLPGHCEDCARDGHVAVHPELGCSDVGCTSAHGEAQEDENKLATWTEEVITETFGAIEIDGINYVIDEERDRIIGVPGEGTVGIPLIRYADTGEVEARLTAWIELEIHEEAD